VVICHRSQGRVIHIGSQSAGCPQEWTQGRQATKEKSRLSAEKAERGQSAYCKLRIAAT